MPRRLLTPGPGTLVLVLALASALISGCGRQNLLTAPASDAGPDTEVAASIAGLAASDEEPLTRDERWHGRAITGPTTITSPGVYRVTRDFAVDATTSDGIVIRSNDVLLLMGERTLTGPGDKLGRGVVIDGAHRVVVQGGRLRSFGLGVALMGAEGCAVRGVRIEGADAFADPPAGIAPQIGVMLVNSASNRIARNVLTGVNLGLFVRGGGSESNRLRWNEVTGGTHGLLGICYNPAPNADAAGPSGDFVHGNALRRFGKGIQASAGSAKNRFVGNVIEYFAAAYEDLNGTNVFERNRSVQVTP